MNDSAADKLRKRFSEQDSVIFPGCNRDRETHAAYVDNAIGLLLSNRTVANRAYENFEGFINATLPYAPLRLNFTTEIITSATKERDDGSRAKNDYILFTALRGYRALVARCERVNVEDPICVFDDDEFEFSRRLDPKSGRLIPHVSHDPNFEVGNDSNIKCGMVNYEVDNLWMLKLFRRKDYLNARGAARHQRFWEKWPERMFCNYMFRRVCDLLPLSAEVQESLKATAQDEFRSIDEVEPGNFDVGSALEDEQEEEEKPRRKPGRPRKKARPVQQEEPEDEEEEEEEEEQAPPPKPKKPARKKAPASKPKEEEPFPDDGEDYDDYDTEA